MFRNQLRRSNGIKTMFNVHAAIKMRILRVLSIVFLLLFDLLLFPFFCAHEIYLKKGNTRQQDDSIPSLTGILLNLTSRCKFLSTIRQLSCARAIPELT